MKDQGMLRGLHPAAKLFALVGIIFSSFLIIFFIGIFIATFFFDMSSLSDIMEGKYTIDDSGVIGFNKYIQLVSHLGLFIIPAFVFAWLIGGKIAEYLMINIKPDLRQVFLGICLIFVSLPFINFLVQINMQLSLPSFMESIEGWMVNSEEAAEKLTKQFLSVDSTRGLLLNIFIIAVIPAIGEELIFRGALLKTLGQWTRNAHIAIWLSAFIFSAVHFQFFGFLPRLFLGALFGYMVIYSGSLWVAIIAHFANNAAAVIAYYFLYNDMTEIKLEEIGSGHSGSYLVVLSILLITVLLFIYWKIGKLKEAETKYL